MAEKSQEIFGFMLPSTQLEKRKKKFEMKYIDNCDMPI